MKTLPIILISYGVTFIPTVSSIKCERCFEKNAPTCSSSSVMCDSSVTSCCSSMFQMSYKKLTVQTPQKFCGFPGINDLSYSMTLNDIHLASRVQCCGSESCNKVIPLTTPRNLTKNGLKCPYCVAAGLSGCQPLNQILCTGLENMCIKFSGYLGFGEKPKEISYQGCATSSACPVSQESPPDPNNRISTSCTKAVHHCKEEGDQSLPVIQ